MLLIRLTGMIYLLIATICFSLSFGLIKSQLSMLPSDYVIMLRLLFAIIIFIPFLRKFNIKTHIKAYLIGIVQFGIMYIAFLEAFKYLQGNEIALLTTTTPVFVAIWASIFGDKFKIIYLFCILMSVVGAGIVVWQNLEFSQIVKGVLLMETSNCTFALGQVFWKKFIPENIKTENIIATAYFGAFLSVLCLVVINNELSIKLTNLQLLSILYLGVVPTGIGFFLWNKGAKLVKSSTLAIMNNLKIPFGVLFSVIIFHEKINFINFLIGSSIILLSILIMNRIIKKEV